MAACALEPTDTKDPVFAADAFSTFNVMLKPPGGAGMPDGSQKYGHGTHELRRKINVLFADGHVSVIEIHKFEDSTTEKGRQQWDPMFEEAETP